MQATGSAFHYNRVPYNKLLTNLACSSRTGEYWPLVVFARTSLCSVRTATTSGQYSPVRPLRSVGKRLILRNTGRMSDNVCSYRFHVHAPGGPAALRVGKIRTTERTKPNNINTFPYSSAVFFLRTINIGYSPV